LLRKVGRTAQVYLHALQEPGKFLEHQWRVLTRTAHDKELSGLRLIDVPDGALFLDVGANRGWATHSIRTLRPHVRIHAFEPNPAMARRIAHLYRAPDTLHAVALSNRSGEFPLYVPVYRQLVFDGLASLSETEARRWLSEDTVFGFAAGNLEIRQLACRVTTLDSFGIDPFFIKIDVQGCEYEVISGGLAAIDSSRPIIFAESEVLDIGRVLKLLSKWNYEVWRFDGTFHPGEISPHNVYFIPESKRGLIRAGQLPPSIRLHHANHVGPPSVRFGRRQASMHDGGKPHSLPAVGDGSLSCSNAVQEAFHRIGQGLPLILPRQKDPVLPA
jgi:FkbM family methyltransferase